MVRSATNLFKIKLTFLISHAYRRLNFPSDDSGEPGSFNHAFNPSIGHRLPQLTDMIPFFDPNPYLTAFLRKPFVKTLSLNVEL